MDIETIDLDDLCKANTEFNNAMTRFVSSRPALSSDLMAVICAENPELEKLWDSAIKQAVMNEIEKCKRAGKTRGSFKIADVLDMACAQMINTIMDDTSAHAAFLGVTLEHMAAGCKDKDEFCVKFIAAVNEALKQEDNNGD